MDYNKFGMHQGAKSRLFKNALRLRENSTKSENMLWERIKNKQLGYKFRRQHPLGIFILDFYCHEVKLCIEVDGEYHHQNDQILYDQERTNLILASGLNVIRFDNSRVINQIEEVVSEIKETIYDLKSEKI